MAKSIYLDTGPITLFFSEDPPINVENLFKNILQKELIAYLIPGVLFETYKHLNDAGGKSFAEQSIIKILDYYSVNLVKIDKVLILRAGAYKIMYRGKLLKWIALISLTV